MVTISVLGFQRYMMVSRGTQFPLSDPHTTFAVLCFIWTYTLLLSIPPVLGWGTFHQSILLVRWFLVASCMKQEFTLSAVEFNGMDWMVNG